MLRTIVCIDGFNLNYRMLKARPDRKWLNQKKLVSQISDSSHVAVVVTNNTDLVEPIRIAVQEAGKRVGLLAPVKYPTQSLVDVASFHWRIRPGRFARAHFPDQIISPDGTIIAKPATWA